MSRIRRIRRKKPRTGSVWKKLLLWGVLGLLVLAAAAVAGSYLYVRAYLKSDGFLAMLEQSAVDDMNVETARIDPLDWDGSGIRCGGVVMEGHEFLTSLQARNIETEFSRWELLKRAFVITSVNIAELKLHLAPVSFRFREKPEGPRSWAEENILPDTFRLEKGSIDSLSVSYEVTFVNNRMFPVAITEDGMILEGDWRKSNKDNLTYTCVKLPRNIENQLMLIMKKLSLSFGGIDLALVGDTYYFIEVNPTGEWGWLTSCANLPIDKAIVDTLVNRGVYEKNT